MKIAICDDEKLFVDKIIKIVLRKAKELGINCDFFRCYSGKEVIELCSKTNIDAVFLDISMPDINGFETAEQIMSVRKNLYLIFVSSNEAMVFDSYKYEPVWFVPKSKMEIMNIAMDKMFEKLKNFELENSKKVYNIQKNHVIELNFNKIAYFKIEDHYIKIVYNDNTESESYRNKMSIIHKHLSPYWFVRVHNKYLVNCRSISSFEGNECILLNGNTVPVSRGKMEGVKDIFKEYLGMM